MASGAASGGASQPATAASATGGYSEAPSAAPLAEVAEERRRALDGELYTREQFMQFMAYNTFTSGTMLSGTLSGLMLLSLACHMLLRHLLLSPLLHLPHLVLFSLGHCRLVISSFPRSHRLGKL